MSQNKNVAQQVLLEVLGNYIITGHTYKNEFKAIGSWVFTSPKNKRKFLRSNIEDVRVSMLQVRSPIMLDKTVENTLKHNLLDTLFNEKGEFETYSVAMPIRDKTGDNEAIRDIESKRIEDFIAGADPEKLHAINSEIIKSLSVDPDYTLFLEEATKEFLSDSQQINPFPNMDVSGYLNSIVAHSRDCHQEYTATRMSSNERTR